METHPGDPDGTPLEDSEDMAAFVRLATQALRAADPVPIEVTELAKLAFEFRNAESVDLLHDGELVGVRATATAELQQVAVEDTVIAWSVDHDTITGVVHGAPVALLELQTLIRSEAVETAADGSFAMAAPDTPWRLVLTLAGAVYATPWTAGLG